MDVFIGTQSTKHFNRPRQSTVDDLTYARNVAWCMQSDVQGGPKKRGHRLMTIILSNLNRFLK